MVGRFDAVLHLMDPVKEAPVAGLRAGPCGRGPVEAGMSLVSLQVWLFQSRPDGGVAFASGRSGEDVGGPDEQPPFGGAAGSQGKWMIRTGLDAESAEFTTDEPACGVAIAIVKLPGGGTTVEQWTQAVRLHADHDHGDHGDHPA
jgi:hypothetical protein